MIWSSVWVLQRLSLHSIVVVYHSQSAHRRFLYSCGPPASRRLSRWTSRSLHPHALYRLFPVTHTLASISTYGPRFLSVVAITSSSVTKTSIHPFLTTRGSDKSQNMFVSLFSSTKYCAHVDIAMNVSMKVTYADRLGWCASVVLVLAICRRDLYVPCSMLIFLVFAMTLSQLWV